MLGCEKLVTYCRCCMWELLIQQCPLVDDYRGGSSAILEEDQWVSVSRELEDRLAWLAPSYSSVCFRVTVVLLADKVGTMAAWPISAIEEMH